MSDQISLMPMFDESKHVNYLLNGMPAICTEGGECLGNVFKFYEKEKKMSVEIEIAAYEDYINFQFSYSTGTYGRAMPLFVGKGTHYCHRANSAKFLGDCIYNVFVNGVIPYDRNLTDTKENRMLAKVCRKVCDKIAKEVV